MVCATSRQLYARMTAARPFFVMAGPNVIESRDHCLRMAEAISAIATRLRLPYVFKASFDKANRTSLSSFRGPGLEEGLRVLEDVKSLVGVPVITDVHDAAHCAAVGEVADVLQIPAFLCRQTDLVVAAARTGRVLHIKKGQWCDSSVMEAAAHKAHDAGNRFVAVCERGTQFGYSDLVVDPRNLSWMRKSGGLVTADVTHSLQQPGGQADASGARSAGGLRHLIPTVARACVAAGVDGLFLEVHDEPDASPCDAPTQWPLARLESLLAELADIAAASRWREHAEPRGLHANLVHSSLE